MICQCKWYSSVPASAPDVLHVLLIPGWVAEYTRQPKYQNTAYCSAQSKIQDIVGCTILTANYRVSSVQCIQSSWCVCNGRSRPLSRHISGLGKHLLNKGGMARRHTLGIYTEMLLCFAQHKFVSLKPEKTRIRNISFMVQSICGILFCLNQF